MSIRLPVLALRSVLLLTGCALLCWGTWSLVRAPVVSATTPLLERPSRGLGQVPLETAVVGGCAVALLACAVWVVGLCALSAGGLLARELAPDSHRTVRLAREVERRCPAPVRRLVATVLGVTLGAGIAGPALATIDPPPAPLPLSGLSLPDRVTGAALATTARPLVPGRASGTPQRASRFVEVRPGDSLWRIAATLLRPGATDAEITGVWHSINRVNSDRIGADPDLIHPGTRLVLPPLPPAHRKDSP